MQGRVREGGDHLAALGNQSKGHTSSSRSRTLFRCNRLESIALRGRFPFAPIEHCFRSFLIITAAKGRSYHAVLRFCMSARAYPRRRRPWQGRSGPPGAWKIVLTTCKSSIKNNIYLQKAIPAGRGLTTLVLFKEDIR